MKRIIIALVTVFLLTITLVACGGSDSPTVNTPPAATPAATPAPTPAAAPDPTPDPTPDPVKETPPPTPDPVVNLGRPFPFAFTTEDIYGNIVTEASLGEHELFFVHFWGTWCGPCISEMPQLAQLEHDFQDRVGFLIILQDFDNKDGAINIYNEYGFPDIPNSITVARETFDEQHELVKMLDIQAVPTTIIIDADGNMLENLIGAQFFNYAHYLRLHFNILHGRHVLSNDVVISVDKDTYARGERVNIMMSGVIRDMIMYSWVTIFYRDGTPGSEFEEMDGMWGYIQEEGTSFTFVDLLTEAGEYEIRIYWRVNDEEKFITSTSFIME